MAEKLALPLLLPNPPSPSKPLFPSHQRNPTTTTTIPSSSPPIAPLLHDFLLHEHSNSNPNSKTPPQPHKLHIPAPIPRTRTRIGKSRDPNRGKPWSNHRLSAKGDSMFVEAVDVVRYMIKHGCRPNQNTYNSIVDWYCKLSRRDEANLFVNNLRNLDPHIPKEEEGRLLERIRNKWS